MREWKHRCELQLLVCEPDPLRPDRVTVGFVLRDTNPEAPRVEVRFAQDLRRVQCIYPDVDMEALQGTLADLESVLKNVTDFEKYLQNLPADFPLDFALLSKGAVLTDSMEMEIERFVPQYLTSRVSLDAAAVRERNAESITYGRAYLLRKMQESFRNVGALNFLATDIPVDRYTFKGDTSAIDFGYQSKLENTYRMLHATSVAANLDRAKILALSWPLIREGLEQEQHQACEMFAVIEEARFQKGETAKAAITWMEDAGIRVEPISAMPALAADAREALRL